MEEEFKRKKAKAKPARKLKIGRLVLVMAGLLYFIMFINAFFGQMVKTYVVNYGKIEEFDNSTGIILRDEKLINVSSQGVLRPIKTEGERVNKGAVIARVFSNSAVDMEKQISDIDDRIQEVIRENEKNNEVKISFNEDIKKIDSDTDQKVLELYSLDRQNNFEKVYEIKEGIDENIRKKAEISGEFGQASQYVRGLVAQKKALQARELQMKENIVADLPGVVSYVCDGFENRLSPQAIPGITVNQLKEINKELDTPRGQISNSIRVVNNFKCYISSIIQNKERIKKLKQGQDVWLRFSSREDALIPAKVYYIAADNSGQAVVTFCIREDVESLLNYRKINFDIVWSTYQGLKIPVSSLTKALFITAEVDDKSKTDHISIGDRVTIKMRDRESKPIPAAVYDISKTSDNEYEIEFIVLKNPGNLYPGNEENVEITWKVLRNNSIPAVFNAKVSEKVGVMSANTSYAEFKEISIITKDNEYAIVNESSLYDNGISLYEEIILNGANIEEGSQVRRWEL